MSHTLIMAASTILDERHQRRHFVVGATDDENINVLKFSLVCSNNKNRYTLYIIRKKHTLTTFKIKVR